ncbi:hypothetical protein LPB90_03830 [Chryseobacterium sp. LC2016-29]|uniref:HNH endonuclease n=1 Tax=Chryseobacterium sp. LC2016-29 TaxID=2897331 RepID=UPI001E60C9A6|nr:hypothetical protein [Chryseobacterium sp. LC2016-29]MCD0477568.1 hypothetical protein [Chryseobacterium sp. LC2016-29]
MLTLKISASKALQFYNIIKSKIKNVTPLGLSDNDIKQLIISEPQNLISLNSLFIKRIIPDFDKAEFFEYAKKKDDEKKLDTKYHPKITDIKRGFKYSSIIGNDYFLADLLDQHTCLYCNRNYTRTIGNSKNKILRAEYDHFYSQSKYPLLALSFYNLLPTCSNCNKKKNDTNFSIDSHLHPYLMTDEDKKFNFSFRKKNFIDNNVKLNISTSNLTSKNKISKTFNDLNLIQIYNKHSDKELKDLLNLRYKYSKNYIDILLNETFKDLPISKEEVYRMIFGIEPNEEDYHKRPFSKFKKDIIDELLRSK